MFKQSYIKEVFRFFLNTIAIFVFNYIAFSKYLLNEENFNNFINSIFIDLIRFLNLNIYPDQIFLLFIFFISLIIVTLVSLTNWYSRPENYDLKVYELYLKIFQKTTLGSVFIFYFLRVFNLSRQVLIVYLLFLPLIFLVFQTHGFFSKFILRQYKEEKYILINYAKEYSREIYLTDLITLDNKIQELNVDIKSDLLSDINNLQKEIQFDFVVFNTKEIDKEAIDILISLTKIRKPIYVIARNKISSIEINKFIYKKIPNKYFDILLLNTKVQDGVEFLFKRIMDLVISIFLIFLLLPFSVFISFYIYIQDFKNPLVKIPRSGLYGKQFLMYKFRTMYKDSHIDRQNLNNQNLRSGPLFKIKNDPRVISKLNWLRKYSIDEIPQLLNVVKGEMSLVGPRPLFEEDLVYFKAEETIRLSVTPGMTGLLQIKARETEDFNIWYFYDKIYIDTWSVWLDLKILILTPFNLKSSL